MTLAPGDRLGPFEILSRIGAGGMGEVWKAHDPRLDRIVAIKTSSAHFSDRFEREARAIAALNHPHICQLYDVGPDYLVMEYIEGKPLAGPLPLAEVLRLGMQIADALAAAHRRTSWWTRVVWSKCWTLAWRESNRRASRVVAMRR